MIQKQKLRVPWLLSCNEVVRGSLAHINRRQHGPKAVGHQCCGRRGAASRGVILVQSRGEDPLTPISSTAVLENKGFWEQALQRPWIPVKDASWLVNLDRVLRKVTMWHQLRTLLGLVWILVPTLAASVSFWASMNCGFLIRHQDSLYLSENVMNFKQNQLGKSSSVVLWI